MTAVKEGALPAPDPTLSGSKMGKTVNGLFPLKQECSVSADRFIPAKRQLPGRRFGAF